MDKEAALAFLDNEINDRYDPQRKKLKLIDFIIRNCSYVEGDFETEDSKVHVEGSYIFSPDLELRITADGVWSHERTIDQRKKSTRSNKFAIEHGREPPHHYIDHEHEFSSYTLEAAVHTQRNDYLEALKKIIFFRDRQFVDGNLDVSYSFSRMMDDFTHGKEIKDYHYGLFTEISILAQVGIIEDFVRLGVIEQLDDTQKQLEEKIAELELDKYTIKYGTMINPAISFQGGGHNFVPHATAIYENQETGVGFEINYSPAASLDIRNPESCYSWAVTIPFDTNNQLQETYNEKFKTPNVDDWDYVDFDYFHKTEFARTIEGKIHYFSGDEETFLQTFARWERALHIMKWGIPKALGPGIFDSSE